MYLRRLFVALTILGALIGLVQLPAVAQPAATVKPAIPVSSARAMMAGGQEWILATCGDGQCQLRGTPSYNIVSGDNFQGVWNLKTYRWVNTPTYVGWQLSTSQTLTCNECYVIRDSPLQKWTGGWSTPNTYSVTYTGSLHLTFSGQLWWSGIGRASWRDWRGIAHYAPCQACASFTKYNSLGYTAP